MNASSAEHLTITEYSARGFHYYCSCGYETDSAELLRAHAADQHDITREKE